MDRDNLSNYPRPDYVRAPLKWQSLNGLWDFLFDDEDVGQSARWYDKGLPSRAEVTTLNQSTDHRTPDADSITQQIAAQPEKLVKNNIFMSNLLEPKVHPKRMIEVPFVFQTEASGINDQTAHEVLWYERPISELRGLGDINHGHRLLLRFGAVDYESNVWVDGQFVGSHQGGHVPFDIDISDAMHQSNARLTVRVRDSPSDRGQMLICVAVEGRRAGQMLKVEVEISIADCIVSKTQKDFTKETRHVQLDANVRLSQEQLHDISVLLPSTDNVSCWKDGVALWSPEHPLLYDIIIRLFDGSGEMLDQVRTTGGMRSLDWAAGDRTFRLNGRPYFQALVLDQGYWPTSGLTPPQPESLRADIEISKQMGFNGCRKHQKMEDPIFLYWADRLGYLVWGEMANGYWFNHDYVQHFDQEWMEAIRRDVNHPCIVAWTPVNESWGYPSLKDSTEQRNHIRSLYYMTKTLDPTRPVNDNCGWEHVKTDLTTFHEYADAIPLAEVCSTLEGILGPKAGREVFVKPIREDTGAAEPRGAPIVCTEFGGVNIAPGEGITAGERDWGYTTASDPADLLKRLDALVMAIVNGGHCCGFVYTQLTDIEQEVNGLFSFDRKPKLDVTRVKAIMDKAKTTYFELLGSAKQS